MWVGLVVERSHLTRPWLGVALVAAATTITAAITVSVARGRTPGERVWLTTVEVCVAAALLLAEPAVYDSGRHQSLAWAWPAAGIIAVAIAAGMVWGVLTALALSVASWVGEALLRDDFAWTGTTASKTALLVLAAVSAATVSSGVAGGRAGDLDGPGRAEMARVLHDGVLQTLAVVQRRSTDDELRDLAREQERDLRAFLYEQHRPAESLAVALRTTIDAVARRHSVSVAAVLADDLPSVPSAVSDALAGAMGEALTNAAKHSRAERISVFVEPDDDGGLYCSVRDNGTGFDRATTTPGRGLDQSIEQRMAEIGGRVEVTTAPGRGTEVQLWTT
ncbi:MAG: ATP-binding protein [Acidimicrobiales bacterium]